MALQLRTVLVRQFPESMNAEQARACLQELKVSLQVDRPRMVINCSAQNAFDRSSLHLLLCCLEEAMKRHGDVRLSTVSKQARAVLEAAGIDRLFEIFESDAEAVRSFQRVSMTSIAIADEPSEPAQAEAATMTLQTAENAA